MLSDDKKIVKQDPDLPALRFLLDDVAALDLLQEFCPELQPTTVQCTYLRYKPGTSCIAAWTLGTEHGNRLVYAKAHSPRNSGKIDKACDQAERLGFGKPGYYVLPELSLVITCFPQDAELPALERLFGDGDDRPLITRLVPGQTEFQKAGVVPLRYKPERRFVGRLDIADQPVAVLKIHTKSRYQQARRAIKSLGPLSGLSTAQAIGHSDRHHAILLSWLAGTPLASALGSPHASASAWEAVGRALARLHRLRSHKLPSRTVDDEIREIRQQSNDCGYVSQGRASRTQRLTAQCAAVLPEPRSAAITTHGDFHPGQILFSGHRVSMIDLDNVALGNGAYDLGSFIAHLERATLLGTLQVEQKKHFIAAFVAGYQQQANHAVDPRSTRVYTASALLRLVHEPFRHRLPDWHSQQENILQRVETMLAGVATTSVGLKENCPSPAVRWRSLPDVEVVDRFGAREDAGLPFTKESLDPALANAAVGSIARQFYGDSLELRSIRIIRHKPGRRCLIAYRFQQREKSAEFTLLGKVHAKRRHQQSYQLQQALWDSGFDDQSRDGISVPRPLGILPQWNMWLQEYVPGQNSWRALRGPNRKSVATRIADAAHKLHQTGILTERTHRIDDELKILEQRLSQVACLLPRLRSRIDGVVDACRELASTMPATPSRGIHRDFYPDQILFHEDRMVVLDHDLYCVGHPSLDIGNFCAHLIETDLRHPDTQNAFLEAGRRITDRFVTLSGDPLSRDLRRRSVDIYTTLSLARHIHLSTQFAERNSSTLPILAACERRLAAVATPSW